MDGLGVLPVRVSRTAECRSGMALAATISPPHLTVVIASLFSSRRGPMRAKSRHARESLIRACLLPRCGCFRRRCRGGRLSGMPRAIDRSSRFPVVAKRPLRTLKPSPPRYGSPLRPTRWTSSSRASCLRCLPRGDTRGTLFLFRGTRRRERQSLTRCLLS